jgi:hypothetical protein
MSNIFKNVAQNEFAVLTGTAASEIFTSLYTKGLWSSAVASLKTFHTSSVQNVGSKEYYLQIWMSSSLNTKENEMFSIAYGNINGSGSKYVTTAYDVIGQASDTPSRAIYSQYKLMCLDETDTKFTLENGDEVNHFYAININRNRFGDKLDPGNFEINIAELNGASFDNNFYTGSNVQLSNSNKVISLIDDSLDSIDQYEYSEKPAKVRNLVSGSLASGIHDPSNPHYYGKVYPDNGAIIISAEKLDDNVSFNTVIESNIDGQNNHKLFTSMSGSADSANLGFVARAVQIKHQQSIFIRVNSDEMNYSNNPTFVNSDSSKGRIGKPYFDSFMYNPHVYVTTIGLYNDNKDLLAVAKLSKPLQKSFNSELSITVKLEY